MLRLTLLILVATALSGCAAGLVAFAPREEPLAASILAGDDLTQEEQCKLAFTALQSPTATPVDRMRIERKMRELRCANARP